MRSSPLQRQDQRFACQHRQPPIELPCSAPQGDGKSLKTTGNPANVGSMLSAQCVTAGTVVVLRRGDQADIDRVEPTGGGSGHGIPRL